MVARPTLSDLAKAAGVSIATVDRVVNGRLPVRADTAKRVYEAAKEIGFHAAPLIGARIQERLPERTVGFLLQRPEDAFYDEFSRRLKAAIAQTSHFRGKSIFSYWKTQAPEEIAERILRLAQKADAIALVSPDHPIVNAAIEDTRNSGTPVFALLSDCATTIRTAYIGIDNRKSGRTAAWMISNTAKTEGKVAIFIGSHRFHGQELREIGFRSFFRECAPGFTVLETIVNHESPEVTHDTLLNLSTRFDDLVGCYIAGGGMEGAMAACRANGATRRPMLVCNELTPLSRAGLADGTITSVISARLDHLGDALVEAIALATGGHAASIPSQFVVPFDLYIPENI